MVTQRMLTLGVPLVDSKAPDGAGAFCRLVLQRKRSDCGIASPVIAALGGQNANRQSEQERGGDSDYAFGHHGKPPKLLGNLHMAVYARAVCDGRHEMMDFRLRKNAVACACFTKCKKKAPDGPGLQGTEEPLEEEHS